ncbi:MAG: polyprenyl synthetase family protein [Alphaproteobacteria bacterium]|nr:polyprenyl synthetase family protein [Rickettsiales bacterium]
MFLRYTKVIKEQLEKILSSKDGQKHYRLLPAMQYICLNNNSKLLRPNLFMSSIQICGRDPNNFTHIACAIEMAHCYSIVHDDLPCMDNDDIRRKKKALHKQFDENIAVLTGNALLTDAFNIIANSEVTAVTGHLSASKIVSLLYSLSTLIGSQGMLLGQALDLNPDDKITSDFIYTVHKLKSGNLFSAATKMGAIISTSDQAVVEIMKKIGMLIGLLLQTVDDIEDFEKDEKINIAKTKGIAAAQKLCDKYIKQVYLNTDTVKKILAQNNRNKQISHLQQTGINDVISICNLVYQRTLAFK